MFYDLTHIISGYFKDEEEMQKAKLFFEYLKDAYCDENTLMRIYKNGWLYSYKVLPESLWENSLLKPYTYYYHKSLQKLSPPVFFDAKTGEFHTSIAFNEMRIQLTKEEVINDLYRTLYTLPDFQHLKRDQEGLMHVLNKHYQVYIKDYPFETIDIIYAMFDKAKLIANSNRMSFLEIYNHFFNDTITEIEEKGIVPQNKFILRTGECVICRGK